MQIRNTEDKQTLPFMMADIHTYLHIMMKTVILGELSWQLSTTLQKVIRLLLGTQKFKRKEKWKKKEVKKNFFSISFLVCFSYHDGIFSHRALHNMHTYINKCVRIECMYNTHTHIYIYMTCIYIKSILYIIYIHIFLTISLLLLHISASKLQYF